MKIGIITHYNVHNHGALLQLYALKKILEERNNSVSALTFKKNFDFMESGIDKKYDISVKSLFWYLSYICRIGLKRAFFNIWKKNILDKFRKPLVGEYYSRAKKIDAVFIGSDEVFSIEAGINALFFGAGIPCKNVFAYAACCGPTTVGEIQERNMDGLISGSLIKLKKISVRDVNTKNVVNELTGIDPQEVCDPVILYGYKNEIEKLERKIKKDYLLVYAYDKNMNDEDEIAKIKEYARKNNLLIVSAGFYHKWCDKCVDADPIELLSYFKYAKCVVTDTFHGSVMSLITKAQFVSKIRGNGNKLRDLLERYNLLDKLCENLAEFGNLFDKPIDYNSVDILLEKHRKESKHFIDACMGVCKCE